ncbi:MAG: ankyrin repeat domain-containing protein, partial [bacterium]
TLFILICTPASIFCQGINDLDTETGTAKIHIAAAKDDVNDIQSLLDQNADINRQTTFENRTAVMIACASGSLKAARYLADKGADLNLQDVDGNTALHLLAQNTFSDPKEVAKLVDYLIVKKGANKDLPNNKGLSPVTYAIISEEVEVMKAFGCDITETVHINISSSKQLKEILNASGTKPIVREALFRFLIRGWNESEFKKLIPGAPLIVSVLWAENATFIESFDLLTLYIKYLKTVMHEDINSVGPGNNTALHMAAAAGVLNVAKALVVNGIDTEKKNIDGLTAQDVAKMNGRKDVEKYLESVKPLKTLPQRIAEILEKGITTSNFEHLLKMMAEYIPNIKDDRGCAIISEVMEDIYIDVTLYKDITEEERIELRKLTTAFQKKIDLYSSSKDFGDHINRLELYTSSKDLNSDELIDLALNKILSKTAGSIMVKDFLALNSVIALINNPTNYPSGKYKGQTELLDYLKGLAEFEKSLTNPGDALYNTKYVQKKFEGTIKDIKDTKELLK